MKLLSPIDVQKATSGAAVSGASELGICQESCAVSVIVRKTASRILDAS
jgi:hypothetical protein